MPKRKGKTQQPRVTTGIFRGNPRGFGFVTPEVGGEDIFIPQDGTGTAFSGDRVRVTLDRERDSRGPSGIVTAVLERAARQVVACLVERGGAFYVSPLRRDLPALISLSDSRTEKDVKPGEWLLCELNYVPGGIEARLLKRVAKSGSVTGDLKAICEEYGLPHAYTAAAEKKALSLEPAEVRRHDFRDLEVFTIDPVDAKDYDDGISFKADGRLAEIGVHIADVACYVTHGSDLDNQARARGFTHYLPGKTIGMLPETLASDRCSLREGVDRLAHSVFLTVDTVSGEVKKTRRIHTLIRSRHRLDYGQVDRALGGEPDTGIDAELTELLRRVLDVTRRMREWRAAHEEFLPFETPEVQVLCSGKPLKLLGVRRAVQGPSAQMIEELMLAANVAVAVEMSQRRIRGFYRVHEAPEKEALDEIAGMARTVLRRQKKLSFGNRGRLISFLKSIRGEDFSELLNLSLVRCMSRAQYSLRAAEHFGLGKSCYCHFTSPIRRYPDLLTHQQLLASDCGGAQLGGDELSAVLGLVNEQEYNADQASFAAGDRLKLRLLRDEMEGSRGATLECLVARATAAGLQLYVRKYGLMGYLETDSLGGSWRFDRKGLVLEQLNRHTRYRVGDVIYARPLKLDVIRGELLLKPADSLFI